MILGIKLFMVLDQLSVTGKHESQETFSLGIFSRKGVYCLFLQFTKGLM